MERGQKQPQEASAPTLFEEELPQDVWGRTPAPASAAAPVPPPRSPAPLRTEPPMPQRLHPARALLKDKRDLRRAVVLMTILGPCRAQEPPER
jgi:hypothetical protein